MFFSKFFNKSFKTYMEKGDKYFDADRFADARHAYEEALEKIDTADDPVAAEREVRERLAKAGNKLALLNIAEAEFAIAHGEREKAREYLDLALQLATDPAISRTVASVNSTLQSPKVEKAKPTSAHSCSGCGTHSSPAEPEDEDHLLAEDRFGFLINTLPEGLASRYAAMGEEFATAYIEAHEGDDRVGLKLYQELLKGQENDILLYEIAIIHFRHGAYGDCERLLRQALQIEPRNELCRVGLVQLLVETGRGAESIPHLESMIAGGMMSGQAPIMLADVYLMLGEETKAMDVLGPLLQSKATAKAAAERLVPILERQNRHEEAAFLFKSHMKGCC